MGADSLSASAPSFKLFLLGAFRLERNGHLIRLPTRKAESLLAYLALHPGPHAREKLAALFWGDSLDELARRSLRTALASLRKDIDDDVISADRETVQLNPNSHLWVDALWFQDQAVHFLAGDSPDMPPVNLDLYRGELLAGFYDDWILDRRERLHALYLDALLRLAQLLREKSEYARAMDAARSVLAVDVANEHAHQHLMFCLWALGDRHSALKQFDECRRVLHDELGVEPSPDTLALFERIKRASGVTPSPAASSTNLPIPLTSFVGRERQKVEVRQLLGTTRLLTLTGVGGCGKTRLAIQVAREVLDQFADGVWWVELASAREDERVLQRVMAALGLVEGQHQSPLEAVLNHLHAKHALLILDNCEHLVKACAELAEAILSQCLRVRILATSREAMRIGGEMTWLVPSLSVPAESDANAPARLAQFESVRLLIERAGAFRHDFTLTPANSSAVASICRRLDGIPLAIELAAARLRSLTVEQIDARLDDRLGLLTTGSRTALPRQQTLRATIDWSYTLLSSMEQALLRRLSVFSGGWVLEAAEAVCAGGEVEPAQVLDLLTHLADKSLLTITRQANETRFDMLETVREYTHEKLLEANEFESTAGRHLQFFSQLAEADGKRLRGEGQLTAYRQLEVEYSNLRVAYTWGLQRDTHSQERTLDALRLATSLWHFWNMRGDYLAGHSWLQEAIESIDALIATPSISKELESDRILIDLQSLKALALFGLGVLLWFRSINLDGLEYFDESASCAQSAKDLSTLTYARVWIAHLAWINSGDLPASLAMWDDCEAYFRQAKDEWGIAWALAAKGIAHRDAGNYALARQHSQGGADIRRILGDHWGWSVSLSNVGIISALEGDFVSARAELHPRLDLGLQFGFKQNVAISSIKLGHIAHVEHDYEQSNVMFRQGLRLSWQAGMTHYSARCLCGLARNFAAMGDTTHAIRLFSVARTRVPALTALKPDAKGELDEQTVIDALHAQLGEAAFQAAWAEGQAMTLEQAVEEALRV